MMALTKIEYMLYFRCEIGDKDKVSGLLVYVVHNCVFAKKGCKNFIVLQNLEEETQFLQLKQVVKYSFHILSTVWRFSHPTTAY